MKPKSMEVLLALARRPREVCSRQELMDEVWKGVWVGEEIVTQAIAQLRRAFGDDFRSPEVIETVPRRGYRLLVAPRRRASGGGGGGDGAAGRRSPFIGRESEIGELLAALDQAEDGRGGVLFLAGEPGIGKTRLAEEVLQTATNRHFLALVGRCSEDVEPLPLLPFVEAVERASRIVPRATFRAMLGEESAASIARMVPSLRTEFPDLPAPAELPPEQQRRYLFNAFLEFLERCSETSPLCLLLDDLQWADEATCRLLRHLAWEVARLKVLILGTFRDAELGREAPFRRVLAELLRQRIGRQLPLGPLSRQEMAELLEGLSGTQPPDEAVDFFERTTEGYPFFVEELYRHVILQGGGEHSAAERWGRLPGSRVEVPESVRVVILQRVGRLRESTREFLTAASIAGRTFDPQVACFLTDLDHQEDLAAGVDEAEAAGLIVPRTAGPELRYEFAHDLIRHSLLSQLSLVRQRTMHLRVVEAMEALYPDVESRAGEVVSHLEAAGNSARSDKAVRYLILAAERALEGTASEDALRFLDRALPRVADGDRPTRARVLFLRGSALRSLLRWEEALRDWWQAIPLFEELGDAESLTHTCKGMAIVALWQARWDEATALGERGLALVGPEPSAERVHMLCIAGLGHSEAGRFDEGEPILDEADSVARRLGEPELLGVASFHRAMSDLHQMRVERQLTLGRRSVELLRGTEHLWDFVPALGLVPMALFCLGRLDEMQVWEPEVERMAERVGQVGVSLLLDHTRAHRRLLESGELEPFVGGARRRLESARGAGIPWAPALSLVELARAAWWRGDDAEAETRLREARADEPDWAGKGIALAVQILLLAQRGDRAALDVLTAHDHLLPELGRPARAGSWHLLLAAVESLALLGEIDGAAALHPLVLHGRAHTGAVVPLWSSVSFARIAGISAACARRWDVAAGHFDRAEEECEAMPNLLEGPAVLRWRAWMLARRGRPEDSARAKELESESRRAWRRLGFAVSL
ncbi:MAG: AAA family ATPase [Acidobacteriota bacterium]|nr:AAA family ATPase [Acidobacteriota bacterium]